MLLLDFTPSLIQSPLLFIRQAVHYHAYHQFLLIAPGFGDHDDERHQRVVINGLFAICGKQGVVFVQEIQEHRSGNAFVPIGETMVLGHKVEQICGFLLK